jgi:hypothetical protein
MVPSAETTGELASQTRRAPLYHLYLDESGSRHLDRRPEASTLRWDWFALAGLMVKAEDEAGVKGELSKFTSAWPHIRSPLHLTDMRAEKKGFAWLGRLSDDERTRFWSDYKRFLTSLPVLGAGCVIDRPGYMARGYGGRDRDVKWLLCRSAFDIVVERAAKFAKLEGRRLKVFYELADPLTDERTEGYFKRLRADGLEFAPETSGKYGPLAQNELGEILVGIEGKPKKSKIMQIADSYTYAIARGGYDRKFDVYRRIVEKGRLTTSAVPGEQARTLGVKYYCFDGA